MDGAFSLSANHLTQLLLSIRKKVQTISVLKGLSINNIITSEGARGCKMWNSNAKILKMYWKYVQVEIKIYLFVKGSTVTQKWLNMYLNRDLVNLVVVGEAAPTDFEKCWFCTHRFAEKLIFNPWFSYKSFLISVFWVSVSKSLLPQFWIPIQAHTT